MYIYLYIIIYIIYNIIKIKKETPPHRVAPIERKTLHNKSCGLRFGRKSPLQYVVGRILGATRNLQPATRAALSFRRS